MEAPPFEFAVANYPLAPCSLYNVGGPARWALLPRNRAEAEQAYAWLRVQDGVPRIVLGGGSNVLIADEGFPGIVVFTSGLNRVEDLGSGRYYIEGGVNLDSIVQNVMLANNYKGVGGLTGIPGSTGGAIYMNAGTVNGTICELMESVDIIDEHGARTIPMDPSLYGYRGQTFCPPTGLILGGAFRFEPADEDQRDDLRSLHRAPPAHPAQGTLLRQRVQESRGRRTRRTPHRSLRPQGHAARRRRRQRGARKLHRERPKRLEPRHPRTDSVLQGHGQASISVSNCTRKSKVFGVPAVR
jgi:UDP-N-acetylenolpyruvoylglucosamine reductase